MPACLAAVLLSYVAYEAGEGVFSSRRTLAFAPPAHVLATIMPGAWHLFSYPKQPSSHCLGAPPAVTVKAGNIVDVAATVPSKTSLPVLDYKYAAISPGLIDVHAHINEPGREDWEGEQW